MSRARFDFSNADPSEAEYYSINFASQLAADETISTVVFELSLVSGVDPNPASRLDGDPLIAGTLVRQWVQGLQSGAKYALLARVHTSAGRAISGWANVKCNQVV